MSLLLCLGLCCSPVVQGQGQAMVGEDGDGNLVVNASAGGRVMLGGVDVLELVNSQSRMIQALQSAMIQVQGGSTAFPATRNGTLQLYGSDSWEAAQKMEAVRAIRRIVGGLSIRENHGLLDLDGFANLQEVQGEVVVSQNEHLAHMSGLANLSVIGTGLRVHNNPLLRSVAMPALATLGPGGLAIEMNGELEGIGDFRQLQTADRVSIGQNCALRHLDGLQGLRNTTHEIRIYDNGALEHVDGFQSLRECGGLELSSNTRLQHLRGLRNVAVINGNFRFSQNKLLADWSGFGGIREVNGSFMIYQNRYADPYGMPMGSSCGLDAGLDIPTNAFRADETFTGLRRVGGEFTVNSEDNVTHVAFPALVSVGGSFRLQRMAHLTSSDGFGALATVGGRFEVQYMGALTASGRFQALTRVENYFVLHQLSGLETLGSSAAPAFDELEYAGGLALTYLPSLRSIAGFNSLALVNGSCANPQCNGRWADVQGISIQHNAQLASVDGFQGLTEVVGRLQIGNNPNLERVGFASLSIIHGGLDIQQNRRLSQANFNALTEVHGNIRLRNSNLFESMMGGGDNFAPNLRCVGSARFPNPCSGGYCAGNRIERLPLCQV